MEIFRLFRKDVILMMDFVVVDVIDDFFSAGRRLDPLLVVVVVLNWSITYFHKINKVANKIYKV